MADSTTHLRHGTWLNPNFIWPEAGRTDLIVSSTAWGFSIGFGLLIIGNLWRQTSIMRNPWKSIFAWMIWGELVVSMIMAFLVWLMLIGIIYPNLFLWIGLLVLWVFQTQLILQIICNRAAMVQMNRRRSFYIKWSVAGLVFLINISVFVIWIPARMQMSAKWMHINDIWDRISKVLFLVVDLALNVYFVLTVRANLVKNGLKKYDKIVKYNTKLIAVSILTDVALVALMSMPNGLVYAQFQPICYLIKLNIELALADLITQIAKEKSVEYFRDTNAAELPKTQDAHSIRSQAMRSTVRRESGGTRTAPYSDSDILVSKTHAIVFEDRDDDEITRPNRSHGKQNGFDDVPLANVTSTGLRNEGRNPQRSESYSVHIRTVNKNSDDSSI